jgi:tetratricopeptide (TPR) repeat protein
LLRAIGFVALLAACAAPAQAGLVTSGYQHFYNLEFDEAIADFRRYAAEAPNEPGAHNHLAEAILYRDMFRAGALETELVSGNNPFLRRPKVNASAEDQRQFEEHVQAAIRLAQARLACAPRDAAAHYDLGVAWGLRANWDFLVRKAWRDALHDAVMARRAHARATEIDPRMLDAQMVQGLYDYMVGSLPLHLRLLGLLAGVHGNKEEGIRTVEMVARQGQGNRTEAEVLLCAIYRRERRPRQAVPLLTGLIERFPGNFLLRMELAQMYSDTGQKAQAIAVLQRLRALKRSGAAGLAQLPVEKICFAEGNIQFWYGDLEPALANLKQAAAAAEDLDLNTGVLAWMRLGQIYDLKGERPAAQAAYQRAIAFAPDSDAAQESRQYLSDPYRRKKG